MTARTWPRVVAFGAALVVAFAAALVVGDVLPTYARGSDTADHHDADRSAMPAAAIPVAGLAVSADGYTLVPSSTSFSRGASVPFSFRVVGPDGEPVTAYDVVHAKELHLIVVRRDLTEYQHLHPVRDGDGPWRVPLDLSEAGTYRVFADFRPTGHAAGLTLGVDVHVGGEFEPVPLPAPARTVSVHGYDVTLRGDPVAGHESTLVFDVSRDGEPVDSLEGYLGAYGHLVSLRDGDLAYLHTHPARDAEPGVPGGPSIEFATEFPTAGAYRLFLDFAVDGRVHTAELTLDVASAEAGASDGTAPTAPPGGHDHDHSH